VATLFFATMRQARAWELGSPVTSLYTCIEANLAFPFPFVTLALGPLAVYLVLAVFGTHEVPPLLSFVLISSICYIFANGAIAVLALGSMAIFYSAAHLQVFIKLRYDMVLSVNHS
jgi:glycosylphosphatidylinositol deacylase